MLLLQTTYSCHLQCTSLFLLLLPLCIRKGWMDFLRDMTVKIIIIIIIVKKSMAESFRLVLTSQKWAQTMVFCEVNFSIIICPWMGISFFIYLFLLLWPAVSDLTSLYYAGTDPTRAGSMYEWWAFWHLKFKERRFLSSKHIILLKRFVSMLKMSWWWHNLLTLYCLINFLFLKTKIINNNNSISSIHSDFHYLTYLWNICHLYTSYFSDVVKFANQ